MTIKSDGGSTSYYELPEGATELNDLIEHKNMSFALGNIFKACYRLGEKDSADALYDLNKIVYFANRLIELEHKKNERPMTGFPDAKAIYQRIKDKEKLLQEYLDTPETGTYYKWITQHQFVSPTAST